MYLDLLSLHVGPRGAEEDDPLVLLAFLAFTALPAAAGRRLSAAELHLVQGLSQGVAEGGLCRVNSSNFSDSLVGNLQEIIFFRQYYPRNDFPGSPIFLQ